MRRPRAVTLAEETFKTVNTDFANAIEGSVGSEFLENAVGDLMKGMLIIFVAGVIVAVALSALWLIILRYMAGVFVWLTVLLLNILTIVVTIYCAMKAGLVGEDSGECRSRESASIHAASWPTDPAQPREARPHRHGSAHR